MNILQFMNNYELMDRSTSNVTLSNSSTQQTPLSASTSAPASRAKSPPASRPKATVSPPAEADAPHTYTPGIGIALTLAMCCNTVDSIVH